MHWSCWAKYHLKETVITSNLWYLRELHFVEKSKRANSDKSAPEKTTAPLQHFLRYSTPSPISMYLFNLQHRDGTCNVLANSWLPEVEGTLYIDEVLHCSSGNGNGVDGRWRIRFNRFPSPMAKTAVNIHTNIIHPNMIKKYHSNISTWFAIYHCREGITNNFYSFMCSVELLYNGNIGETFRSDPENSLNRGVLGLQNRGGQNLAFMIGERESEIWYQLEVYEDGGEGGIGYSSSWIISICLSFLRERNI